MIRTRLQGDTPFFHNMLNNGNVEVCLKEDVDKVIAEKDKVIAELKAQKAQAEDDCAYWKMSEGNAAKAMHETEEYAMQLYNEARHHKYKRCLAMADFCSYKAWYYKYNGKEEIFYRWMKFRRVWAELAKKFKEAK